MNNMITPEWASEKTNEYADKMSVDVETIIENETNNIVNEFKSFGVELTNNQYLRIRLIARSVITQKINEMKEQAKNYKTGKEEPLVGGTASSFGISGEIISRFLRSEYGLELEDYEKINDKDKKKFLETLEKQREDI